MPTFSYDAKDTTGNSVSGVIDAPEARGAASVLREQGLFPSRIELANIKAPRASSPASGDIPSGLPRPSAAPLRVDAAPFLVSVPLPILAMMYRQLSTLMNAGVPMVQTLTTLATQTSNGRLKSILTECAGAVGGGAMLSTVFERYPAVFTVLQVELVRAGEVGGMLDLMCNRIAEYLEREVEIRRKLKRETLYPKIVLSVAWLVGGILIFVRAGGTGGALGYLKATLGLLGGSFGVWWLARYLNQFPQVGAIWDQVKMLIPGMGGVARKYATARFTRALGTLYAGGILLPRAVEISARACGNRAIGQAMLANINTLYSGGGVSGMLAQSGLLAPIAVQMAQTGEQTGSLDQMMDKVSDYLESEADAKAHQLATFAGVAALVFAAIVVGAIAISMYGGMYGNLINDAGTAK